MKELDNMNSDRMKTVQLNVAKQEEIDQAVDVIKENLKDPEKGGCMVLFIYIIQSTVYTFL